MPATDVIHDAVKNALISDGWVITDDPYTLKIDDPTLFADLAAERPKGDDRVMEQLTRYRDLIKRILNEYVELSNRQRKPDTEAFCVFDEGRDEYLWMTMGWSEDKRIHSVNVHVRLRNCKFWIEEDWTEEGIATDLLNAGVPNDDIVLGFQPPEMRQYTEFAVA